MFFHFFLTFTLMYTEVLIPMYCIIYLHIPNVLEYVYYIVTLHG
jgi:hypothetical protein